MSEGAELIYMRNKELQNKKTGNKVLKNSISGIVPRAGIEPARFPTGVWDQRVYQFRHLGISS